MVALKVAVDIGPVVRAIGASTGAQCRRGRRRAQARLISSGRELASGRSTYNRAS